MIFYDFDLFAPNPWIVWIFAQEKGISLERRIIDLFSRENRREPFLTTINPMGELPALQLEDGTVLTEVTPICEYLEEIQPSPPLIGSTPAERAQTRMWVRRIVLADYEQAGVMTKPMLPSEAGAALKAKSRSKMFWLDAQMQGQTYLCGSRYSLADIYLYCFLQFGANHGQPIPAQCGWLCNFFVRMKARPHAWHGTPSSLD
jgi:glutathione S-transferase